MTHIRVLLVDDEPLARQRLRQMLADHADIVIAGEAEHVEQARELVRAERPDLILLDIRMPGANGFALVEGLHLTPMPYIIFVTAYAEHAVEAFDGIDLRAAGHDGCRDGRQRQVIERSGSNRLGGRGRQALVAGGDLVGADLGSRAGRAVARRGWRSDR